MDRRAFITGLGVILAAPRAAEAQQAGKVWLIGVLQPGENPDPLLEAFAMAYTTLDTPRAKTCASKFDGPKAI